jgi:hypothetical protein
LCRSGRWPKPTIGLARGHGRLRARRQLVTSFTASLAEAVDGCVLEALHPTKAGAAATRSPFREARPRSVSLVGVLSEVRPAGHPAEAVWLAGHLPESRLPPALHIGRWGSRVQDAQRGIWTTPPMGFGPLRRVRSGRSLHRFASPIPSALRVFHPLSGLIPPGPRGFVSRHFRPWGLVMAFRAFPTQPAVAPLDARCSLAVSASLSLHRASSMGTLAPAFVRLLASLLSPFASSSVHRTTLPTCSGISSSFAPTKVSVDPSERP